MVGIHYQIAILIQYSGRVLLLILWLTNFLVSGSILGVYPVYTRWRHACERVNSG